MSKNSPTKSAVSRRKFLGYSGALAGSALLTGVGALSARAADRAPADLAPLPLMGIPGWWTSGDQDDRFYADRAVFRPPRGSKSGVGGAQ